MDEHTIGLRHHYSGVNLFNKICNGLVAQGKKLENLSRKDLSPVDEFHVRGAAVSLELAEIKDISGKKVLDIGSGLGGAARMLAERYACMVTGIDLSEDYVDVATQLSKLVHLSDNTTFIQGDATSLPFEGKIFDVVWTQHVQMNIRDKCKFYAEIEKVLKPGGLFLYYDLFEKQKSEIRFPVPWAHKNSQSFLISRQEMYSLLSDLGFKRLFTQNQTKEGIRFFDNLLGKLNKHGPPEIGLHFLMGENTIEKLSNLQSHLKDGTLELESGVFQLNDSFE